VLLDVEGATTCASDQSMSSNILRCALSAVLQPPPAGREGIHVPQRLQSVCVLLWRFPKLEVPFAVVAVSLEVRCMLGEACAAYSFWLGTIERRC
jgi:hypothetical protein